jgi:uncharacterized protein (DUF2267 family)
MGRSHFDSLESSLQKTNEWIRDMGLELGDDDRHHGYVALRAALHALRDRLTVEQSAHLAAQLPLVLRGLYYEGWSPARVPQRIRTRAEYLESIRAELEDAPPSIKERQEEIAQATFRVLARHIDWGEVHKIQEALPKPLRSMWPQYT